MKFGIRRSLIALGVAACSVAPLTASKAVQPAEASTSPGFHPYVWNWNTYRQYYSNQVWQLSSPFHVYEVLWSDFADFAEFKVNGPLRFHTNTSSANGGVLSFDDHCRMQVAVFQGGPTLFILVPKWRSPIGLAFVPAGGCRVYLSDTGKLYFQYDRGIGAGFVTLWQI